MASWNREPVPARISLRHREWCWPPSEPGRFSASIPGFIPAPSPASKGNRRTATWSIFARMRATSSPAASTTARARFASASSPGPTCRWTRPFFRDRLQSALHLRQAVLGLCGPGQACRLVFSESDGMPGCVVDRYDRWLVLQFTSLGLAQRREMFADLLMELAPAGGNLSAHRTRHRPAGGPGTARRPACAATCRKSRSSSTITASSSSSICAKDRRPASISTSATIAWPWRSWPGAGACSMPSATPAASACTPSRRGPTACWASTFRASASGTGPSQRPAQSTGRDQLRTSGCLRSHSTALAEENAPFRPGRARSAEIRPLRQRHRRGPARLSAFADAWRCGCSSRMASWRSAAVPG